MPHPFEENEASYNINPEMLSRDRPPQLNETVSGCGCRRGTCGGGEEGDRGSDDEDNASTLIGSNHSEPDLDFDFPRSSDGPEQNLNAAALYRSSPTGEVRQMNEIRTRYGVFENGAEGFQLGPYMMALEEVLIRPRRVQALDEDMADSMRNEPHDSDHGSLVTYDARSVSTISPGSGIGDWAFQQLQLNDCHVSEYHFLVRPLRLTPQLRYCRGLMASHMIVPDADLSRRGG